MEIKPHEKIDVKEILKDLENYRPRRKGWSWRTITKEKTGEFAFSQVSKPLKKSISLSLADAFDNIDPQPDCVITSEIASGRFEDDIRRMRMAAWHGADHIMVIRTLGQSHFDGLLEGTPEGIGGVPITRKQIRATRKALDIIEDEVGREINFHSYVSGVAGPEIAVLFSEEGINGAHQDPQYNVLYRNINMVRSFVDAAEAKTIMGDANILQIDGAHNANATAKTAWNVMPELLVQHGINSQFSVMSGMKKENIALSTVPPTAPPAPKLKYDLPYAIALRELFEGFKFRAQMNTRYATTDEDETNGLHFLDMLISRLTSADIQSTITSDEAKNVPWHYNSVKAVDLAKEVLTGLDGLSDYVKIDENSDIPEKVREIKERSVLFLEEILETGGYYKAVEKGFFVDSGNYPHREGDGIKRNPAAGVSADSVVKREKEYFAPVCSHFGINNLPGDSGGKSCDLIGGCTLCNPEKIVYIDELDSSDNVNKRLSDAQKKSADKILPEVEWNKDGFITLKMFFQESEEIAKAAALTLLEKMGLRDGEVIHYSVMHPAEGTLVEVKGRVSEGLNSDELIIPEKSENLDEEEINESVKKSGDIKIVAGTMGNDEHSAGLREIIDIKHGGLEKFGFICENIGTSVSPDKLIDAGIEFGAKVLLASTIISHGDVHRANLVKINELCIEKGVRDKFIILGGGPQITQELAEECDIDGGFGRRTKGIDVASVIVKKLKSM